MNREFVLSAALHVVVLSALLISAPFEFKKKNPFDEVVRVTLTAPSALPSTQPKQIAVPLPATEETPDIPIAKPQSVKKAAAIAEKPRKKPKTTTKKTQQSTDQNAQSTENQRQVETPGGNGSPFAGATVDNATFNYPYWFTQAFNKIGSNYHIRVNYGRPLVCVVYFQVIRSGRVIQSSVQQSSGVAEFDEACLQAVENSAPFPPLPRDFLDEIIGITLPFKYEPR